MCEILDVDAEKIKKEREQKQNIGNQMLPDLMKKFERASGEYARAFNIERDPDWFVLKLHEELGELTQIWNRYTGRGRRGEASNETLHRAMEDEAADLLGHVLLLAGQCGLDLEAAIERKWRFRVSEPMTGTRPEE